MTQGSWAKIGRNPERQNAMLTSLRRPVPRHESTELYLAGVLGVVGDTPLPTGEEMLSDGSPAYEELLMELVERHGGGWEIFEPSPERIAALHPGGFDAEGLRALYAGELDYYPDDEDEADDAGLLGALIDRLLPDGLNSIRPMPANTCCVTSH